MMKRLKQYLLRLTPFAIAPAAHPVFCIEARALLTDQADSRFLRLSVRAFLGGLLVGGFIIAGVWIGQLLYAGGGWWFGSPLLIDVSLLSVFVFMQLLGDWRAVMEGARVFQRDRQNGRWDLLRATPLRETEYVSAKHALALLRLWRLMMWSAGLRAFIVVVVIVRSYLETTADRYTGIVSAVFIVAACLFGALWELALRMRGLAAAGMAVGARSREGAGVMLGAISILGVFWMAQMALLGSLGLCLFPFFFIAVGGGVFMEWLFILPVIAAGLGLYAVIQSWGLRHAAWNFRLRPSSNDPV